LKDPIAHVILNVKDMAATVAAIKAAGGSMAGDPRPYGNTGVVIGIAVDPVGNRVELIQRALRTSACPPSEEKLSEWYWNKSDLSVIEQALTNGPQTITRNGATPS